MNFFTTLRPILQNAYQLLTENSDGVSGKVDIYLENEEFPCDEGVYFYPTPPTKRFVYDLDQLSGGEKSLASLALQYSIAIASKSPFLMLDEIDAFLDSANVLKFVKLVNESIRGI
jgi:structural maintenance of chromosome 1